MKKIVPASELAATIGQDLGASEWFTIDQSRIDAFADVTEDHQFIHIDAARAAATPFGGTIAHGFLTLSLLTRLTADIGVQPENTVMGVNYGFEKVRFIQPVRAGQRVRARLKPLSVLERAPGQFLVKNEVTVEIDGEEKPALVAEWLGLLFTGPA
jgi:acyl dehydratase